MKTILCVTYGGGHVTQIIPVVRELEKNPDLNIKIIALTTAAKNLKKENIPYQSFKDFIRKDDQEILAYGTELAKNIHRDNSDIPYAETIAYLGASFFDLVKNHGEVEAHKIYKREGRRAFLPLTIMSRIFSKIKPDFVVTTNVARAEKAARIIAQKLNIPLLSMQGLPIYINKAEKHDGKICDPINANYISVISHNTKLAHQKAGSKATDKYVICGNPAFDKVFGKRTKFNDFPNKQKVLIAGAPYKNAKFLLNKEAVENIQFVITSIKTDKVIFIRPHPSEDISLYKNFIRDMNNPNIVLADNYDLYDLIYNVDLVIAYGSTIIIEALYMQKKVLQIKLGYLDRNDPDIADIKSGWQVTNMSELKEVIPKILDDKTEIITKLKKFNQDFPKQKSAPKIAKVIIDHLN